VKRGTIRLIATGVAVLAVGTGWAAPVLYTGAIQNLSNTPDYRDERPQVNNDGHVVWQGWTGTAYDDVEILYHNGSAKTNISVNAGRQDWWPQINNTGHVVWHGDDGSGDFEIWYHDGAGKTNISVDNTSPDEYPDINDSGHVAWHRAAGGAHDVYFYNGSSTTNVSNQYASDMYPQISNNDHVAWEGYQVPGTEVHFWDSASGKANISNLSGPDRLYSVNDSGHVVWQNEDSFVDVWYYDGSSKTRLTENRTIWARPQINNSDHVVWAQDWGMQDEIFYWDGTSQTNLSATDDWHESHPQINNQGHMVWQAEPTGGAGGGDFEIFYWDGSVIWQITDNDFDDISPQLSDEDGGGEVYITWYSQTWDGGLAMWVGDEVYRTHTPEPASLLILALGGAPIVWRRLRRRK
jgi:hypothetical protein